MPTEMELTLEQTQQGVSYEVSKPVKTYAVRNTQVLSDIEDSHGPSDAMHNPLPATQRKNHTSAGNPVKKILLKLNLSDHRLMYNGRWRFLNPAGSQDSITHAIPDPTTLKSSWKAQVHVSRLPYSDTTHLSRSVNGLKMLKITMSNTSPKEQAQSKKSMITTTYSQRKVRVRAKDSDKAKYGLGFKVCILE
ncbi:hypothetical protein Tco_0435438 [Tanacetum coccineum]|uniref:Uncharacterized protein n=1 Tax=Tanacetum coccineum TaxID=301880 RepID=A0ABQ5A9E5_9ASTR